MTPELKLKIAELYVCESNDRDVVEGCTNVLRAVDQPSDIDLSGLITAADEALHDLGELIDTLAALSHSPKATDQAIRKLTVDAIAAAGKWQALSSALEALRASKLPTNRVLIGTGLAPD